MSLNPDTLLEEDDWEKLERQKDTGVLGTGHYVTCFPSLEDRTIQQVQHRAACLSRPHHACTICPHQTFTLLLRAQPQNPYEMVACPRWRSNADRIEGKSPETYVPVELGTCFTRPFDFCPSCPSKEVLEDIGADKVRDGWYGRWRRFTKAEEEDDDG